MNRHLVALALTVAILLAAVTLANLLGEAAPMIHVCRRCGREVECGDRPPMLVFHLCRPPRSLSQVRPALTFEERGT